MTIYAYTAGGEVFYIDDVGRVARPSLDDDGAPKFSDTWRITGAVRFNNFGRRAEYHPFPACMSIIDRWRNANGTARWHLCDVDHGKPRVQMQPSVSRVWIATP